MKKFLLFLPLLAMAFTSCEQAKPYKMSLETFRFSLKWGVKLDASYDSESGKLVSFTHVRERKPEDYITTYQIPNMEEIYEKAQAMRVETYPEQFDPFKGKNHPSSNPSMSYVLNIYHFKIEVKEVAVWNDPQYLSNKGKKFFELVDLIIDTIHASDEWKSLPEPEYYYR